MKPPKLKKGVTKESSIEERREEFARIVHEAEEKLGVKLDVVLNNTMRGNFPQAVVLDAVKTEENDQTETSKKATASD